MPYSNIMRSIPKQPRIIGIDHVDGLTIAVIFNNGETREIDFEGIFQNLELPADSPIRKLEKPANFKKVNIANDTLSWDNVNFYTTFKGKKMKVPFEIGADVLYQKSKHIANSKPATIGSRLRAIRVKSGLTQDQVAKKSSTTRNYISRIENEASGIELDTLFKIVRNGLGKEFEIRITP
jgi:DNA-binding XRE family transcriptional regulator